MKRSLLFTIVVLLAATSVFAGTLTVVSSFTSAKNWRKGLEYAGGYLYTTSNYSDNSILVYTTTGSLVRSIPTPASAMGVEVSNAPSGYLWLNTFSPANGYRMVLSSGSVAASWSGPASGYGITSDGTYLYWSTTSSDMMYVLTTTGSVVRSFTQPGGFPGGCDYVAPGYLWLCNWSGSPFIYYCTTMGSVIDSFSTPGAARPSGVTWDGNYVWYHEYSGTTGPVFRATVNFTNVAPASVGKVKALFR
jgi:glycosidase